MKYIKFLFVSLLFVACSTGNPDECKLDINTPDSFIGNWWEDETTFDRITRDDIVNVNRTPSGSFSTSLCKTLQSGDREGELRPVIDTEDYFTFRVRYYNYGILHRTYFRIADDTIGRCDHIFPCPTYKKLYKKG